MSYDAKCYELAADFLADNKPVDNLENRAALAQTIQDAIEDFIGDLKEPV